MNRTFRIITSLLIILVATYFLGPSPDFEPVNNVPHKMNIDINKVEEYVRAAVPSDMKPGNDPFIVWADSVRRTEYSIVYLHGFTADPAEGSPIHKNLAERFGCNLYVPLMTGHGRKNPDALKGLTPQMMVESAKEAIGIGKIIGEKVIVIGTSTGCTYGIYLAANDPAIKGLVTLSANIDLYDPTAPLLDMPWGRQIAEAVIGSEYRHVDYTEEQQRHWYADYHIDGLIALRRMMDETMTSETFSNINIPVFSGYYYKNDEEMDKVISVEAIQDFMEAISTPEDQKQIVEFPDGMGHVIGSDLVNPNWKKVEDAMGTFMEEQFFSP